MTTTMLLVMMMVTIKRVKTSEWHKYCEPQVIKLEV